MYGALRDTYSASPVCLLMNKQLTAIKGKTLSRGTSSGLLFGVNMSLDLSINKIWSWKIEMIKSSIILPRWLCKHKTNQSIVNSNLSHVYATKAVHSLVKGLANDYVTFGERNKFSTQVWNQQAADLRYKQKQRWDPEIHQQPRDERRS